MIWMTEPSGPLDGPLAGIRVLDLTSVIMGPLATQLLGDLGAEIILIEGSRVDINRDMGVGPHPHLSGVALNLLRNKRSVTLNLKSLSGHTALLRIAATCDVLVTNLRPGPLARAALRYEDIVRVRPDIVYCQAQGYPTNGNRGDDPAYDDIIQSASGLADAARRQTGIPQVAPTIMADKVCGLTIAYSVIAALYRRSITGQGDLVEVPMEPTMVAFTLVEHGGDAIPQPPFGPAGYKRILVPNRRPQASADGWIHVLPYSRDHYDALFEGGGRSELVGDPRYSTPRERIANANLLYQWVAEVVRDETTAHWLRFCRDSGIPVTEVANLDDLVERLPDAEHPVGGVYKSIPPPVQFRNAPTALRRPAPLIGEHTEEVLLEVGFALEEIAALRAAGGLAEPPGDTY
jgi:crotonobetainyl-CoA:carnitine CoA-transferase CaiB-like acyl-CoA transferase